MAVYCPECGRKLPDEAEFCDNCGTRIPNMKQPEKQTFHETAGKKKSGTGKKVLMFLGLGSLAAMLYGGYQELMDDGAGPTEKPVQTITHNTENSSGKTDSNTPVRPAETQHRPAETDKETVQNGDNTQSVPQEAVSAPADGDISQVFEPLGNVWFDDFLFYENDVYENGIPDGAVMREAGYISGEWKYCLTFNRTLEGEERIDEIGTAEVSFGENAAQLILHPMYIRYSDEVIPETDEEVGYEPFAGEWDPEYIDVNDGRIFIGIGPYYSLNDTDYALGNIIVKDSGMFGDFLMVRP